MRCNDARVARRKAIYRKGMRVKLTQMIGEENLLPAGTLGTVVAVDDCVAVNKRKEDQNA